MAKKESYESPELCEVGEVAEVTKEVGIGLQELFASIVSGGPISIGHTKGSVFS
jgi:hypothetical protein